MFNSTRFTWVLGFVLVGVIIFSAAVIGQTPAPTGPVMRFTATTANVSGAPDSVRIDVLAWSTDADRDQMLAAWNLTPAPPAAARGTEPGARGEGARGARGAGARGEAPAAAPPANAAQAGQGQPAAAGARGGRGGRGGAAAANAAPKTPEAALAAALQSAKTVGYLWTSESAGYSFRYAYRIPQPDGGERIIFATDRRLGAWNNLWKPAGNAAPTDYEFTVIELHVNAKGVGEGKTSLTGKVVVDSSAKTIALEGYNSLPIVFKDVKRSSTK